MALWCLQRSGTTEFSREVEVMEVRGRTVHFGVQLQGQDSSWAEYAAAVRAVEELGYGSVWTFDHLLPWTGADDRPAFETLTTLGALAVLTNRARIGVLVNGVLYRDPAVLAKAAAQADEMSGRQARVLARGGLGGTRVPAYGMDFPPLAERYERLDEALEIVKSLWAQHRTTFHGRYYQLEEAPCDPKPVQSPYPPITVGGSGLGSLGWRPATPTGSTSPGSPAKCVRRARRLRQFCQEIGRDFDEIELSVHTPRAGGRTHARGRSTRPADDVERGDRPRGRTRQVGDRRPGRSRRAIATVPGRRHEPFRVRRSATRSTSARSS